MIFKNLITANELSEYKEPDWVIVDCRFDLTKPAWGLAEYLNSHIPGAVYAHLDKDLSGKVTSTTGRHPLPDETNIASLLAGWGIHSGNQVVVYDTSGGAFASRLWWMLVYYGHSEVAVLDGGFPKWLIEGYPTRSGVEIFSGEPVVFPMNLKPDMLINVAEVDVIRNDPNYLLVDARTPIRFRGDQEPIDSVAGHIPGAANRFHGENLKPDGTMKSGEILKSEFQSLMGKVNPKNVIVYCGSGVTSCLHLLALDVAGLPGARLYAGSWSEWIRDSDRPIATGG
jgi:thiosulfate/3-mercaptopyruvate sulfurtransferase